MKGQKLQLFSVIGAVVPWLPPQFATTQTHLQVQYLLAQDAALEAKDKYGRTALLIALSKLRLSLVNLLVQYGANVEVRDRYYVALVQILLNENVDMEAKDDHGQTALMRAASCGHVSVVKLLVEKGAKLEPDSSSSGERTALGAAAASGWKEVTEFLLQAEAILEQKSGNGSSALITAASRGHYDVVAILLASHGNINAVNNDGETPLLAVVKAQSQLIEHLSLIGTERLNDVPQRKRAKSAALIRELKSIILLLVSSGADIEVEDSWGETALYLAASGGLVVTTRFLLNYGANPNYVNPRSKLTPLEIASRSGHNVVAWLLTRKLSERGGSGVVSGFSIQPSLHTMAKMKEKPSGLVGFETTRLDISGLSLLLTTLYDNIKEASTWEFIPLVRPKNNTGAIMPSETQPPISSHITETVSLSTHINSNDHGTKAALFFLSQTPAPPSTEPESTQLSRLDANGSDMTDKNTGRQSPVNMEDENISKGWIGERLRAVIEPANNVLKADGVHIQTIALVGATKVGKSSLIRQISLRQLRNIHPKNSKDEAISVFASSLSARLREMDSLKPLISYLQHTRSCGLMLVFDVGDIMSFHFIEEIKDDVMKLREVQRLHPFITLIGNKADILENERQVSKKCA